MDTEEIVRVVIDLPGNFRETGLMGRQKPRSKPAGKQGSVRIKELNIICDTRILPVVAVSEK